MGREVSCQKFLYHCSNVVFIEYMYYAVWGIALPYLGSILKHQGYQVWHTLLLSRMWTKATVKLSTFIANIPMQSIYYDINTT